jgi:hypothetical protein
VTAQEIDAAREAMRRFRWQADVRRAIDLYEGKARFALDVSSASCVARGRDDLCRLFVRSSSAALQGGGLNPSRAVFGCLDNSVSVIEFAALEAMLRMRGSRPSRTGTGPQSDRLADAYQIGRTGQRVRRGEAAYRRLVSQNYPTRWSRMDCRS